ncbi:MAG TPA: hypothetical protein VFQ92_24470 [Blastocatellia bacterium]|nr:hypothetical protein [Blastocatellia bacterium]
MLEWLSQISASSVFLAIGAIGFLFLLVTLVFGEIFEHFEFDHDIDHDIGHDGPSFFNTKVISVFITAFGGFGAIGIYQGLGVFASTALGLAGGVTLGAAVYFFARLLYSQQATSVITSSDLVGLTAQVTVAIPNNGFGQVRCLVGESMVEKIARSREGFEIPYNSLVRIEEITGDGVIVSLFQTDKADGVYLFKPNNPA